MCDDFKVEQAGAELGQAQAELGLEDRVFMLWFEFQSWSLKFKLKLKANNISWGLKL